MTGAARRRWRSAAFLCALLVPAVGLAQSSRSGGTVDGTVGGSVSPRLGGGTTAAPPVDTGSPATGESRLDDGTGFAPPGANGTHGAGTGTTLPPPGAAGTRPEFEATPPPAGSPGPPASPDDSVLPRTESMVPSLPAPPGGPAQGGIAPRREPTERAPATRSPARPAPAPGTAVPGPSGARDGALRTPRNEARAPLDPRHEPQRPAGVPEPASRPPSGVSDNRYQVPGDGVGAEDHVALEACAQRFGVYDCRDPSIERSPP